MRCYSLEQNLKVAEIVGGHGIKLEGRKLDMGKGTSEQINVVERGSILYAHLQHDFCSANRRRKNPPSIFGYDASLDQVILPCNICTGCNLSLQSDLRSFYSSSERLDL